MGSRLFWRRSATAVGLYSAMVFGILGTIVAARGFSLVDFGLFATVLATVGFFQSLLDLTVEDSLTKYGFRYVVAEDWGRLRRLFRRALELKLAGGLLAAAALIALAPLAEQLLQPAVFVFQHCKHQVVLALEVLVERSLADANVGQHLVEPDVAEAIAVEPWDGGFDEAVARGGHRYGRRGTLSRKRQGAAQSGSWRRLT